jgi:hypothetical protein
MPLVGTFSLALVALAQEVSEASSRRGVSFYEYVVDGSPLRDLIRTNDVGVLSDDWGSDGLARQLLVENPFDERLEGRALIYGCRECLDIDCGGIAARISRFEDRIRWDVIERYWVDDEEDRLVFRPTNVGPFEFDLAQYRAALEPFLS